MRNLVLIISLVFCTAAVAQTPSKTAIVHVNIVDVEKGRLLKDKTVLIDKGVITAITAPGKKLLTGYTIIDGKGKFLIPGLIDSHVHLHYFFKINQPSLLQAPLDVFLYYGVTGIREASGSVFTQEMIAIRDSIESGKVLGPKMYASGIATSTTLKKFNAATYTELVGKFKKMGVDGIKVKFTTLDETKEIIDAAHSLQLPVYGHTANPFKPVPGNIQGDFTPAIVDYGIDGVMHTGGYPPVRNDKIPPPPKADSIFGEWLYIEALWLYADEATEQELIKKMIRNHVWLEPTLTIEEVVPSREQYKNDPGLKFSLMSYNEYATGWPPLTMEQKDSMLQVFRRKQSFVKKFYDRGGLVLAGTDHLYGSSLHKELELLTAAGLSPAAALKAATYNNAKALGWLDQLGTVAEGKKANLVLLDKNPLKKIGNCGTINSVIINGVVLDRKKLNKLLKEASLLLSKYHE